MPTCALAFIMFPAHLLPSSGLSQAAVEVADVVVVVNLFVSARGLIWATNARPANKFRQT